MRDAQAPGGVQVAVRLVQAAAVRKPGVIPVPAHLPGREGALCETVSGRTRNIKHKRNEGAAEIPNGTKLPVNMRIYAARQFLIASEMHSLNVRLGASAEHLVHVVDVLLQHAHSCDYPAP